MPVASPNHLNAAAILVVTYLAVFFESSANYLRNWIGAQVDLVPVLMVYCGLSTGLITLGLTALLGGLFYDALSANPLGISIFPQFLVGFVVYQARELILREQPYARFVLGTAASAAAPLLTLLLLWGGGYRPLIGWGTLWQWAVVALGGGVLTPVSFWFFDRVTSALAYSRPSESTFRPDREIKRGRN
jgi:hypothetical protein